MTKDISDQDIAKYMNHLAKLEDDGQRTTATFGPLTAMIAVGAFQLAIRHPRTTTAQKEIYQSLTDQFKTLFAGSLGEEIINRGEHPEFDR
ncbi:hypothetical protein [Amycolatopsis nigrescens]|uniref:hypothetical protein n=1 Tax=Amycolatopsis nigrescens TaxID=381445 RepID=UPI000382E419|nr:hypothetical protein [Amycolatopsis nigrescens]